MGPGSRFFKKWGVNYGQWFTGNHEMLFSPFYSSFSMPASLWAGRAALSPPWKRMFTAIRLPRGTARFCAARAVPPDSSGKYKIG